MMENWFLLDQQNIEPDLYLDDNLGIPGRGKQFVFLYQTKYS